MSSKATRWSTNPSNKLSLTKKLLSYLSLSVRNAQYQLFLNYLRPNSSDLILDVGTTPNQTLVDANFFEQMYPYKKSLDIASIEDCRNINKKYGLRKFIQIKPNTRLPIKNKNYGIVVSWATLEHVGGTEKQRLFIKELDRVAKKVFITIPYKYCIYEPHTEIFFLHWLPEKWFRKILIILGKNFFAKEENLRILSTSDVKKILPDKRYQIKIFKMFGIIPSHLLIYKR